MKRSERLEKINAINHGMVNMAGAGLANAQAEHNAQVSQLEQLKIYKADYAEQFRTRMAGQITPQELQDYRYFFASIDTAIGQQESMVEHYAKLVEKRKQEWLLRHQEVQKIDHATANLRKVEQSQVNRREQKLLDELSSQFFGGAALSAKH
jgi:flagellar export protein FliJ